MTINKVSILGCMQSAHKMNLCSAPSGHGYHLLFKQEPQIQENLQIAHHLFGEVQSHQESKMKF